MTTDHIHPSDKADALEWAVREIRLRAPQGGLSDAQARARVFVLEQLRDAAQREARA